MDGRSLLPVLRGEEPSGRRQDFLVEHLAGTNPIPTYCAVRSTRWTYVRYTDGEEELYDLASDPAQLRNLATDPRTSAALERMRERLEALCEPPPPGYLEDGLDPRVLLACGLLLLLFTASALRSRRAVTKPNG